jgi:hypothetical protein
MRSMKRLLAVLVMITAVSACSNQYGNPAAAGGSSIDDDPYSDAHAFRYYAGPGADIVDPHQLQH